VDREIGVDLMREGFISVDKDKQEDGDNNYKRKDRNSSVIDVAEKRS